MLFARTKNAVIVHCEQGFSWEQRGIVWCFCTLHVAFRTRNTFVVCALCALPFIRAKISLVICAPHAVLLERGILCFMYTLRVSFRTRNTFLGTCAVLLERGILCFYALRTVLLERGILCMLCASQTFLLLYFHFARCF